MVEINKILENDFLLIMNLHIQEYNIKNKNSKRLKLQVYFIQRCNGHCLLRNSIFEIICLLIIAVTICVKLIRLTYTVKHAHAVTSIKQSPVLKGHLFLYPVIENFI